MVNNNNNNESDIYYIDSKYYRNNKNGKYFLKYENVIIRFIKRKDVSLLNIYNINVKRLKKMEG